MGVLLNYKINAINPTAAEKPHNSHLIFKSNIKWIYSATQLFVALTCGVTLFMGHLTHLTKMPKLVKQIQKN